MVLHGFVIVTRRGGGDGSTFPMVRERVLLGRAEDCDIRWEDKLIYSRLE